MLSNNRYNSKQKKSGCAEKWFNIKVPTILNDIKSPEQLIMLLQTAQQLEHLREKENVNFNEIIDKAEKYDHLLKEAQCLYQENQYYKDLIELYTTTHATNAVQSTHVQQAQDEILDQVASIDLEEGHFLYASNEDKAVFRMNDGLQNIYVVTEKKETRNGL